MQWFKDPTRAKIKFRESDLRFLEDIQNRVRLALEQLHFESRGAVGIRI